MTTANYLVQAKVFRNGQDHLQTLGIVSLVKSGRGYKARLGQHLETTYPTGTKTADQLVKAAKYLANEPNAVSTQLEPTRFGVVLVVSRIARPH